MIKSQTKQDPLLNQLRALLNSTLDRSQRIDEKIIRRVEKLRPLSERHFINQTMRLFTRIGDWDSWTLILVVLLLIGGLAQSTALRATPGLIATFLISHAFKRVFKRPRPSVKLPDLKRLLGNPDAFSFPSAHSACAWSICLGFSQQLPQFSVLFLMLALGISYSRLHVGAHYLSDIVGGSLLGIAIATLMM